MPTVALLTSNFSNTDITTATQSTASVTWGTAERGLFVAFSRTGSVNPPTPTVGQGWSTWTLEATQAVGTVSGGIVTVGSGTKTDQAVQWSYASTTSLARTWAVFGLADVPADPIGLVSTGSGSDVSGIATLAGSAAPSSAILVLFTVNFSGGFAAVTDWTEFAEAKATTPILESVWVLNTTGDHTYEAGTWTTGGYGWIALEILHKPRPKSLIVRPPRIRSTW